MSLRTFDFQSSLPGMCLVEAAVAEMAGSGAEARGAVFYTAACTLASPRETVTTGAYADMYELSSLRAFVAAFAAMSQQRRPGRWHGW